MKNVILLMAIVVLVMAGCSDDKTTSVNDTPQVFTLPNR